MSTKKIYLIRHGQTDYNLKGIVQGSGVDTSLNETGRNQAKAFFEAYRTIDFKKIYTSGLKRTVESVQSFIDLGVPFESYPGLNEISWGARDGKIIGASENDYYQTIVGQWNKGNVYAKPEGGESPVEVAERIKKVFDIILSRHDESPILICMHGRAIRILLASLVKGDLTCMDTFLHENLCLYILNYTNQRFEIEKSNDLTHLKTC